MRTVSSEIRRAVYGQESGQVFVPIITIEHSSLETPFRFVGDTVDLVHGGETYTAFPFQFELPPDEQGRVQTVTVAICNVDRELITMIRSINTPPTMTLEIVRVDDPDDTVAGPYPMVLSTVSYNASTIEGELRREKRLNIKFPKASYSYLPANFPGMF